MKIEEAIQKSWGELWEAASIGIWNSYVKANIDAQAYSNIGKAQEPDFIATLVLGITTIAEKWNNSFLQKVYHFQLLPCIVIKGQL